MLSAKEESTPTTILPGELAVGGYKAAMAACKDTAGNVAVINCAGTKLHDLLPLVRPTFDLLRHESPPRLLDVEWEDAETFEIQLADIISGLAWAREHVAAGRSLLINCAQGKSRSGTMAVAYLVAKLKVILTRRWPSPSPSPIPSPLPLSRPSPSQTFGLSTTPRTPSQSSSGSHTHSVRLSHSLSCTPGWSRRSARAHEGESADCGAQPILHARPACLRA